MLSKLRITGATIAELRRSTGAKVELANGGEAVGGSTAAIPVN